MRWRVVIEAPIVNAEGGVSDNRYWVWGTHFSSENVPFIPWKHLIDFHDYELVDMALACLERAPDEEYIVYKRARCDR